MSELTKIEELKQKHNAAFHHGFATAYAVGAEAVAYAESLDRELLSLRTLRDAGDEEVNWCREELAKTDEELRLIKDLNENHDIAITRGQTRTDAVNKAAEWAKECEGLQEQLREAREEIERLNQIVRELKDNFGEMEVGA